MVKEKDDVSSVVDQMNKKFGPNKVILIGDKPKEKFPTIPSGSIAIDYATNGGYAIGRIIEVYGENASGKTTLALHALAEAQKMGMNCAFIDMEHAFNGEYAEAIGVDVSKLFFSQPDYGEEALSIVEALINTKKIGFIVVDSVAALTPKAEIEGEMGEAKMGLQARMMGQAMRKLVGITNKSNVTIFFINQTRIKIGVMFGDPTTTTGGEALKFATSQRLHVLASTKIKDKDGEVIGNKVVVKVIKNKIGKPHTKTEFSLIFGQGIDKIGEILDLAVELEIIKKAGSWYSYGETKLGQGEIATKELLEDNPELLEEIKNKLGV